MSSDPAAKLWVLVPARGGSKGIPRKNLRLLGDKPLLVHTLTALGRVLARDRIVVSTEDPEVAEVGQAYARVHERAAALAGDRATLDEVAVAVAGWLLATGAERDDLLVTVQPTSPFLRGATVLEAARILAGGGARSVVSVRRDAHLRWALDEHGRPRPLYAARVNRQELPPTFVETGGVIGVRIGDLLARGTRVQDPVALLELDAKEGLDIDGYADWAIADFYARRKRIVIRADAGPSLGMGHVYRALALAHEFGEHDLRLVTRADAAHRLGLDFLSRQPYPVVPIEGEEEFFALLDGFHPDLVVLDVLDTEAGYVARVKRSKAFVVSFEDLGPGARRADLVVNDLYTDFYPDPNHWYGVQHSILSPELDALAPRDTVRAEVERILVTFGGTDERNLSVKALAALERIGFGGDVVVVCGPGYAHPPIDLGAFGLRGEVLHSVPRMGALMRTADLAVTSAGRTVTELMVAGVPMIVLCQNPRELRHTHASGPYGVINLGLGEHVAVSTLAEHILLAVRDRRLREGMVARGAQAVRGRSNRDICQRILRLASSRATPEPAPARSGAGLVAAGPAEVEGG